MIVGMIFNLMLAIPLVLMVIQFARLKPDAPRRPARRPQEVWEAYQRTMQAAVPPEPSSPQAEHRCSCGAHLSHR
jgi:hypothetical protein